MSEDNQEPLFTRSRRSIVYEPGQKSRPTISKRAILIAGGILILIALVIFAVIASGDDKNSIEKPTSVVVLTDSEPTPTISESTAPTAEVSPTDTPKLSATPTPTTSRSDELNRENLTIEIQNGSGVAGAATKASKILEALGYDVVATGNADSFDYETTTIEIKSTKKAYLELLKSDLEDSYTIDETSTNLTGSTADAVIILGAE